MKLLIDMNLSPRWLSALRAAGFDVRHWSGLGAANAPDEEIAAFAQREGLVLLTNDLDFGAILAATNASGPSVVQIRADDISPEVIGAKVLAALAQMAPNLESGAIATIDPDRHRIRLLPLKPPNQAG